MTNSKLVIAALAALSLTAGRAYAQGDDDGNPCGGGEAGGNPCGGGGDDAGGTTATAGGDATTATPTPAADTGEAGYPQSMIDRPRVLPKGMLEASADVDIARLSITVLGVTASSTSVGLGLAARYGLAPKIDALVGYGFSLKDFEIKGDLHAAVQYSLAESAKMGLAARVSTGYSVLGSSFDGIGLGVNFQYKVTPKIGITSPGDQITMGFSDGIKPMSLNLPVGLNFQANEKINAFLLTSIGTIGLSPSGNSLISDITPLTLGATFSPSNKMDVGASIGFLDLQHAGDAFIIGIRAAMRM